MAIALMGAGFSATDTSDAVNILYPITMTVQANKAWQASGLKKSGETLNDEDIARLSPLCHGHINMLGHYSFTLAELVTKGHLRPLKEASEAENVA